MFTPPFDILIVCGDQLLGRNLVGEFTTECLGARLATHGARALDMVSAMGVDLVIVSDSVADVAMLDLCHRIKAEKGIPVIAISTRPGGVDVVRALEVGADDVVVLVRPRELVARARAVLRRYDRPAVPAKRTLSASGVHLDLDEHVVAVAGERVILPLKEFALITEFVAHPGRVLTRRHLIEAVWGADHVGGTKTLDVHIRRLRSKVEDDPGRPRRITTVRGVGYRYADGDRLATAV